MVRHQVSQAVIRRLTPSSSRLLPHRAAAAARILTGRFGSRRPRLFVSPTLAAGRCYLQLLDGDYQPPGAGNWGETGDDDPPDARW